VSRPFALAAAATLAFAAQSLAGPVRAGFDGTQLPRNDDGSTGLVPIGFSANFFGTTYTQLYVNNNGNVTFNAPLGTFTPFNLGTTTVPIIAPFFADVDTRNLASGITAYGPGTVNGRPAFGVTWPAVGFFASNANALNTFQVVLIDRSDTGAGNFDIEFNYDQIQWETGQASGGNAQGLGGNSARAGFANGSGTFFEIPGSAVNGAFLDGSLFNINGTTGGLIASSNIGVPGRWLFTVRDGQVVTEVPEPATLVTFGAVAGLGLLARRRRKAAAV
jgi:hypothetical protein